jgi:hypothetical protein
MEMHLAREDLWEVVDSGPPEETDKTYASMKAKNRKALADIELSLEEGQIPIVKKLKTAKEAWEALQKYHLKSTLSNKVRLLKQLCQAKLENHGDMEGHLFHMEGIFDRLAVTFTSCC